MRLTVHRAKGMFDSFTAPSDKSLTHRSLLFGAIASGPCRAVNPLNSEDAQATRSCLEAMGVSFLDEPDAVQIVPPKGWSQPTSPLYCGNSGTTVRLLSGLIAGRDLTVELTGDASLSKRPMKRIADPLSQMGAIVEGEALPITIHGHRSLKSIQYLSPTASAQVKSCILLAGLSAQGRSSVIEPSLSRDHTERMLKACGVEVDSEMLEGGAHKAVVSPAETLQPFEFRVPGDISSAAFFITAALLMGREVTVHSLGVNPTRTGLFDVLLQTGTAVRFSNEKLELEEPTADVTITPGSSRKPFAIDGSLVPRLIDEIPVLAILASQLNGVSTVRGAKELRVKESDRIAKISEGLRAMGGKIEVREDGFDIEGPTPLIGTAIDAAGDHRIGMSFAVAGLIAEGETIIEGAETIATSYPTFEKELMTIQ